MMSEVLFFFVFIVLIIVLLLIDIGAFGKKDHEIGFREALAWTTVWVTLALSTWLFIFFFGEKIHNPRSVEDIENLILKYGHQIALIENNFDASLAIYRKNLALEYLTGYVVEYSLSLDNIFVIVMIFYSFNIEKIYYHRVLFWGILGAIIGLVLGFALISSFSSAGSIFAGVNAIITLDLIFNVVIFALLIGLIGGIYHGIKASRVRPVIVLKGN